MRTLTATELQELTEIKALISAKGARARQILTDADAFGYRAIINDHCEEIDSTLNAVLQDNILNEQNNKYLGEYKGMISDLDLYIEVNQWADDEDGETYYYGTQKVYINGNPYSRDFVCERKRFQDAVDTEIYKRIE